MKAKATRRKRAKDLYLSPLFVGRRCFVERSCDEWWILSAKHGLLDPERTLAPYDVTLKNSSRPERRRWSAGVVAAIETQIRPRPGDVFEIHAGAEYRDFGLMAGLQSLGCTVRLPTKGMGIGMQLRFYSRAVR